MTLVFDFAPPFQSLSCTFCTCVISNSVVWSPARSCRLRLRLPQWFLSRSRKLKRGLSDNVTAGVRQEQLWNIITPDTSEQTNINFRAPSHRQNNELNVELSLCIQQGRKVQGKGHVVGSRDVHWSLKETPLSSDTRRRGRSSVGRETGLRQVLISPLGHSRARQARGVSHGRRGMSEDFLAAKKLAMLLTMEKSRSSHSRFLKVYQSCRRVLVP